jgi:hypothetical protein
MRTLIALLLLSGVMLAQNAALPADDAVRIHEFYRLAAQIQDNIWPDWSQTPAPLVLVTSSTEFLTHHPAPPKDFVKVGDDLYARPRQFPAAFLATFPAFGPPSVIVVGEPANTLSKTSTPWLFTLMHEHFHQLQESQPGFYEAVEKLGLSHGDATGMWMLNYPFPYEKPAVSSSFAALRDLLLAAVAESDPAVFRKKAGEYIEARKKFFAQLTPDEHKYFAFQLWKEGIARYTEIKAAESAVRYQPSPEFAALKDYRSFADYAALARPKTLDELKRADLLTWKREVVYSFGATEGFLLDRLNPGWRDGYFRRPLSLDSEFENVNLQ